MEFFIQPTIDISDPQQDGWRLFADLTREQLRDRWRSADGIALRARLLVDRFDRAALASHVGRFNGHYDLRGIDLAGIDLAGCDLSGIDWFAADLSRANLTGCNLSDSYLSEANLKGTCLDWALLEGALLDNVAFDSKTSLLGVKLHTVNFVLATLLQDLAITQQRIQQLEQHHPLFAAFLRYSSDYGRSFNRYLAWVLVFVTGYATVYWVLMGKSWLDCLYFSTVTFATVGYGDILPTTLLEKIVVMSEIGIGYLMGGLLVAILAKRVLG